MKKSIVDQIFNRKFQQEITRETLQDYKALKKKDSETAMGTLIAYVLKFKKVELSSGKNTADDFSEIKRQSMEVFSQSKSRKLLPSRYIRIAAAASVLLLFGLVGYWAGNQQWFMPQAEQAEAIEFNTQKGQQSELILPDGTLVALNYDSKLKYHITSDLHLQEVELEGEAFFKVTKNKSRTFRVITHDMNVDVLGTEFDVRAYKNDLKTETTLLEGSVEINDIANQSESIILKPGERWSLNKANGSHVVTQVDPSIATLWRDGEYYFDKISLRELANTLERMYEVNIHFQDSSLENEVYSGSVYHDDSIAKLFDIINLTVPLSVHVQENDIWITRE